MGITSKKYFNSQSTKSILKTREVKIGNIPVGGDNPIRIQSMTNTNTLDTEATVGQVIELVKAGCEYVRITTQGIKEAENLKNIKDLLQQKGISVPLIADVHFNPKVAELAAGIVEKVRINPGNYVDKPRGKTFFTEKEYNDEIIRIKERIEPLIQICKAHGTALRIGSNHGSLSERIMSRYGDTPEGMVESALEFVRICRELDFHNLVLSMKSSNTRVMVYSTRLLVHKMKQERMNYPIHLGVTEAGAGDDGRIRSAVGIGSLLEDGIGDTIRVSLTENPVNEIPVVKALIERYNFLSLHSNLKKDYQHPNPFEYQRRKTTSVGSIGGTKPPVVVGYDFNIKQKNIKFADPSNITDEQIEKLKKDKNAILVLEGDQTSGIHDRRKTFYNLMKRGCMTPVIIKRSYSNLSRSDLLINSAIDFGGLLIDGLGDGIWLQSDDTIDNQSLNEMALDILQASRVRFSKTEFIACPSCGRTLFDIEERLKEIRKKTGHLKNLKIGVMGCIVNGPGEMADADYGYVGAGPGKITLYKGRDVVKKNIDEELALETLIMLIKDNGDWKEKD